MKKALLFGLIAAGAAVAAAAVYKSKNKRYVCDNDYDEDGCADCCCDCEDECCDDLCDIPAEKAEDTCISGDSCAVACGINENNDPDKTDEPTGI